MLTDSSHKNLKRNKKRLPTQKNHWYSDSQKLEAVKCWLITGNLTQTAAALGIGLPTIRIWRYSQWWEDLVKEIKSENSIVLTNKLRKIADKALTVTEDRLENGDWVLNQKTGEMVRRQVPLRDAARVANDLLTKVEKLDKKPQEAVQNEKIQDTLSRLAAKFEEFANKRQVLQVTDVMFVEENKNSIHDERETGLQEGSELGEDEETNQSIPESKADEGSQSYGESREGETV